MQKTKYYCDKCKKEVPESGDLASITIEAGYYCAANGRKPNRINYNLCVSCREKIGMVVKVIKDDAIVPEVQNIKDRLFDIVMELLQECRYEEG